jgi:hypothetical protein
VPDLIGPFFDPDGMRFLFLVVPVKETQFHAGRVFGKQREVHTFAVPSRT